MAKAIVALRAMLKPMRETAVRRSVRRLPLGLSAAELATCSRRAASAGSALMTRTTSSISTCSFVSALRTRTATSGKLGRSIFSPASSRVSASMRRAASAGRDPAGPRLPLAPWEVTKSKLMAWMR